MIKNSRDVKITSIMTSYNHIQQAL